MKKVATIDGRLLSGIDVFVEVVERGSFIAASTSLAMTPSGVSRAIARLETCIGVRLFDRTSRTISVTDDGRRFHERVAPLLAGIEEAANETAGASTRVGGHLRVKVDLSVARLVLAPHIASFMTQYPALSVEIVESADIGDLVGEGFDAAVRFGEPEPSSLVRRLLFQTRVVTCASPAYIAKHGRPKHPRDFANGKHECIRFRDPRTRRPFGWFLQRGDEMIDVDVKGRLVVSSVATMLAACTAGYGIAQVIELGIGELFRDGDLVQILPEWSDEKFPLSVYYPSRNHPPARVRAFVDFIVDVAR